MSFGKLDSEKVIEFTRAYDTILNVVDEPIFWLNIFLVVIKIIAFIVVGRIAIRIIGRAVQHMMIDRRKGGPIRIDPRRSQTIGRLVNNIVSYTVNFIVILLVLSELGVELAPLLAGAGVLGLAIGFGAQSLVKDVITGFFIIFEDQFAVGDVIRTGAFQGTVEEIGLRVTRIKSWTGEVHIIPNGSITQVTNYSTNNSVGIDIAIAYEADVDRAIEIIKDAAKQTFKESEALLKEPQVLGIQTIEESNIVIRVGMECKPNTHFGAVKLLNASMKQALENAGIEIASPKMVTLLRTERAAK